MQTRTEPTRTERQRVIVDLLQDRRVRNQAELQKLLASRGLDANQATLSRDLHHLGVVKGPQGYELPPAPLDAQAAGNGQSLWHAVQAFLLRASSAQNLCVLHAPPSGAQPLGLALDQAQLPGVVGTIAGDDTVLAICSDARKARALAQKLLAMKAGKGGQR
jgi:transcriptional regulator of arginine metabolism